MELPELRGGALDQETLQSLLEDLGSQVERLELRVKGGPERRATEAPLSWEEARHLFEVGAVMGLQVRYRWQGSTWSDTLLRKAGGVRLLRFEEPADR